MWPIWAGKLALKRDEGFFSLKFIRNFDGLALFRHKSDNLAF